MQGNPNRHINPSYFENNYQQYGTLPPNLPVPITHAIDSFHFTIDKIFYLNQLTSSKGLTCKIVWWGMSNCPLFSLSDFIAHTDNALALKYLICCGKQRFLGYLNDMKILPLQFYAGQKYIGKAYANFSLIKGWQGEVIDLLSDLKSGNKKIGEAKLSLKIVPIINPYAQVRTVGFVEKSQDE